MPKKFVNTAFLFCVLSLLLTFSLSAQPSKRANFNRSRTFDVQHYIIRVSFDRANKIVFGDTTVQLKPLQNDFKELELDAVGMKYDSVKLESSGKDLVYRTSNNKIFITLDKAYAPADLISIRFKYSTKPEKGIYFIDPMNDEGEVKHSAQIWTQNEPEDGRFWFPSYDFPDDKATSEEFLTVNQDETAIGNGEQLETIKNSDGTQTFHYKMPIRHSTYVTSFIIGKYAKLSNVYKNIPLGVYVYPGKESLAKTAFGKTPEMMRIYEELTGIDFPYNKYDQTIVAGYDMFSAMENITATTFSDRDVFLGEFDFGRDITEDTVAHELAHSWFGNLVTCKNWAELWLNEGFATFMEAAYREKMYGRERYLKKIRDDVREYKTADVVRSQRHGLYNLLAADVDSIFDSTTYQKGGAVIHTLRETVGDKAFWQAIHNYLESHKFENVETVDLQKAMEEASGQKLDWFFSQWVYGGGYPSLDVEPVFNSNTKTLTLNIKQTQESGELVPAVFILPMDVEISNAIDSKTEKLTINKRVQSFTFKLTRQPQNVFLDMNLKIPLKNVKYQEIKIVSK